VKVTLHAIDAAGRGDERDQDHHAAGAAVLEPLARAVPSSAGCWRSTHTASRGTRLIDAVTLQARGHLRQHVALSRHHERATRLEIAESDAALRDVVSYMWEIALGIER